MSGDVISTPEELRRSGASRLIAIVTLLVIVAGIIGYLHASPYLTIQRVRSAAQRGDAETVAAHVDFPSVRASVREWMNGVMARELAKPEMRGNPFPALGVMLAGALSDRLIDAMVSPEMVRGMVAGNPPPTKEPEAETSRTHMRGPALALLVVLSAAGVATAHAEDRVRIDTFDQHGNRTGYVLLDKQTGRIDAYDRSSKHLSGYGKVSPDGRVDVFGPDGRRLGWGRVNDDPKSLAVPPGGGGGRR